MSGDKLSSQTEDKFRIIILHGLQGIIITGFSEVNKFKERIHMMEEKRKEMENELINLSKKINQLKGT